MGVAGKSALVPKFDTKRPFLCEPKVDFFETSVNGFFDLKFTHISTKFTQLVCNIKYLAKNVCFMTPPQTPLVRIRFLADSISFFNRFFKKRYQNAQEIEPLHMSWDSKLF